MKAFRLADNKVSEIADWDFEKLEEELNSLEIDMSDFGFFNSVEVDINDEDFLSSEDIKEKEPKKMKCPYCEKEFEI